MDYTSVKQKGKHIIVSGIKNFCPTQILDCGQAFRWHLAEEMDDGKTYSGFAHGRRLSLTYKNDTLILYDTSLHEFEETWKGYFDLDRNYEELHTLFIRYDADNMKKTLAYSPGLRLMRQDPWEILISFILSQNSNIPRIKKMISLLCENFGKALPCGGFAFPDAKTLAILSPSDLADIKSGYRAPYIIDAAKQVVSGALDLSPSRPTAEIKKALLNVHGVGPKVADCVLLFGFGKLECFPLDVWMKRVMAKMYPCGFPAELNDYAGIAQQYLFHYARNTFSPKPEKEVL